MHDVLALLGVVDEEHDVQGVAVVDEVHGVHDVHGVQGVVDNSRNEYGVVDDDTKQCWDEFLVAHTERVGAVSYGDGESS